jgi:hypothetical protein
VTQQPRWSNTPTPACTSSHLLYASPYAGFAGCRPGMQELSPRPPTSPSTGVAGRASRLAGTHQLPGSRAVSNPAPSWASIVRDGACAYTKPAVLRQDFLALYELCIDAGLRTCINFRHQAGIKDISISCRLSAPSSDTHAPADARRRRRWRKRVPAAAAASQATWTKSYNCRPT